MPRKPRPSAVAVDRWPAARTGSVSDRTGARACRSADPRAPLRRAQTRPVLPDIGGGKSSFLLYRHLAQKAEVVEQVARAENHAGHRIVCNGYRKAGLGADTLIEILEQRAATGEDDAA